MNLYCVVFVFIIGLWSMFFSCEWGGGSCIESCWCNIYLDNERVNWIGEWLRKFDIIGRIIKDLFVFFGYKFSLKLDIIVVWLWLLYFMCWKEVNSMRKVGVY